MRLQPSIFWPSCLYSIQSYPESRNEHTATDWILVQSRGPLTCLDTGWLSQNSGYCRRCFLRSFKTSLRQQMQRLHNGQWTWSSMLFLKGLTFRWRSSPEHDAGHSNELLNKHLLRISAGKAKRCEVLPRWTPSEDTVVILFVEWWEMYDWPLKKLVLLNMLWPNDIASSCWKMLTEYTIHHNIYTCKVR